MIPLANHWKHWIKENWVKNLNTKYRKHHRTSFSDFIVTHQSLNFENKIKFRLVFATPKKIKIGPT